jgi:type IV pilus assembly protein PilQ
VLEPIEVEVIPLRFADVGPTTRTFQGQQVTIPGVSETLFILMGESPDTGQTRSQDDPNMFFSAASQPPPRISIDPRTNSVVVQGTRTQIEQVRSIIRQLDRPLQMVQIEVIIASADVGVVRQLGLSLRGSIVNDDGSPASIAGDSGVGPGAGVGNPPGGIFDVSGLDALNLLPNAPTSASFVIRGGEVVLQAQLSALAQQDRARILSAPRLVTIDNLTARITRSQNIYVQVDTRVEDSASGGVGLEEIQTGLTLEITPSIVPAESAMDEALVRLNLRAENSSPGSGSFGQIDVRSQEVQTNVLVPDGATFVIGGLFDDSRIEGERGVPGLKDIPVIGALFRSTNRQVTTTETVFFITPRIVTEQTVLSDDIAVRVGSQEYIDRQRRLLSTQYGTTPEATGYGPVVVDGFLLEDE